MSRILTDIVVIGGGVIGLATALRLRADGRDVAVVEPNEPGSGASYGNVLERSRTTRSSRSAPPRCSGISSRFSSIQTDPWRSARPRSRPCTLGWRGLRMNLCPTAIATMPDGMPNSTRTPHLRGLTSPPKSARVREAFDLKGLSLSLSYEQGVSRLHTTSDIELRRSHGVSQELLSANDVLQLEPRLPHFEGGGLFFPNAMNLTDPGQVMRLLSAAVQRTGVDFIKTSATCITRERDGVRVAASPFEVRARTVVIAAGAHSRKLAAEIGDRVPLDTERGYHVEYDMAESPIERPVCPATEGFYLCPMRGRLRVAGMVELGDLASPANPQLLQALATNARRIFPELGAPSRTWLGFHALRMPDPPVPVIRPSKGGAGRYPRLRSRAWTHRVDARATHRPLGQRYARRLISLLEYVYGLSNRIEPSELDLRRPKRAPGQSDPAALWRHARRDRCEVFCRGRPVAARICLADVPLRRDFSRKPLVPL